MSPTPASHVQEAAARDFVAQWTGKGNEKGQTQPFWLHLLRVLGVEEPEKTVEFEKHVDLGNGAHGFIDAFIPETRVLIEQKSLGTNLEAHARQSDNSLLSPYAQAKRYADNLRDSKRPRWIVTCNFAEWRIHDMENPHGQSETVRLADLPDELYRLHFLANPDADRVSREEEVSFEAGRIVDRIYKALLAQYGNPTPETLRQLNILCVRLVFCLYAEDAGLFTDDQFREYLAAVPSSLLRTALLDLFDVLDTPEDKRSPYLRPALAAFPYVNGGLFAERIDIPQFTDRIKDALLQKASADFDWAFISPTIFGALFESTLGDDARRGGGMHYTSPENIHKVIDPLFLDGLRAELDAALAVPAENRRNARLEAFQEKLGSLTFLDPACGSGNFLTETYLSLRRLENEAIAARFGGQMVMGGIDDPVHVHISQFHGIEINDFAVRVAQTALWIAESQMLAETAVIVQRELKFLPLKTAADIREGNALRLDWSSADYIIGNPPFVGASMMTAEQKAEAVAIFGKGKRVNSIDYVGAWYHKAAALMQGTTTRAAFVSTNSITQGEQVAPLWRPLVEKYGVHIDFAHRTFRWDSESNAKAHVHCVIVGFSAGGSQFTATDAPKALFDGPRKTFVPHINPYLVPAPDIFVETRPRPLCDVPPMTYGNKPTDDGNFILTEAERESLLSQTPALAPFIRRYVGAKDFIRSDEVRYCLWLKDAPPALLHANREVMRRIAAVRVFRLASSAAPTRALAEQPWRFFSTPQTEQNYLAIPEVSSERRRYIPIGFMDAATIASNKLLIVPTATLFHFGVLTSNVHMAWMRTVTGRLKSDYQYSGAIVYNNFPWPDPTEAQKAKIGQTAQAILDARAAHPESTLADLYDGLTMPPDLLSAHRANDRAVCAAYGFPADMAESGCVAALFRLYQSLAEGTGKGRPSTATKKEVP
jgi:hypothetical protein